MKTTRRLAPALAVAACFAVSGCLATLAPVAPNADAEKAAEKVIQFNDIPVPANSKMLVEDTVVFGSGETWTGRLSMKTGYNAFKMFDFYKQELPAFQWKEITSLRAAHSILTYQRGSRISTIQIDETLTGSVVTITISPEVGAPGGVPLGSSRPVAMAPAPMVSAPVVSEPLPMRRY